MITTPQSLNVISLYSGTAPVALGGWHCVSIGRLGSIQGESSVLGLGGTGTDAPPRGSHQMVCRSAPRYNSRRLIVRRRSVAVAAAVVLLLLDAAAYIIIGVVATVNANTSRRSSALIRNNNNRDSIGSTTSTGRCNLLHHVLPSGRG